MFDTHEYYIVSVEKDRSEFYVAKLSNTTIKSDNFVDFGIIPTTSIEATLDPRWPIKRIIRNKLGNITEDDIEQILQEVEDV